MIYTIDRITEDVRVCMDQDRTSDALFADGDEETLNLDAVIKSKILESVRRVHLAAPYHKLDEGHNFGDDETDGAIAISWGSGDFQYTGWVKVPDDFLRLVVFEMSDWERPVYQLISTSDPVYAKQRSRTAGVRGTAQRPVCAIGMRTTGRVLEFYTCKSSNATVTKAVYIPQPEIDSNNGVEISEQCYEAVVYMVAGMTLFSCGESELSKQYLETAKTLLNNE